MGVSFWEVGQREKAVTLTKKGIEWMEKAAKSGSLDAQALSVPYNNLAAMHRQLGAADAATQYEELAERAKSGNLK